MKNAIKFIIIVAICYYNNTIAQINNAPVVENVVVTQRTESYDQH